MKGTWLIAWRYVTYHRGRSILLMIALALTVVLPISVQVLVAKFERELSARAARTPLVLGAKGSRYDLVLSSLYFKGRIPEPVTMADVDDVRASNLADALPVIARNSAKGFPLVGVELDYYEFRRAWAIEGTLPQRLGDCVLGAEVARELGLGPGDSILSDQENLYDISKSYPLKMHVTGVLAQTDSPDDRAVFTDLFTIWVVEGIGHGHRPAEESTQEERFGSEGGHVKLNASIFEYNEITPENEASFHFHAEREELPLTGIICRPKNDKGRTILRGRYSVSKSRQLLVPDEVIGELLGFIFRLKAFFDANALAVFGATILFLSTIVLLSIQVRRRELLTLEKIGAARLTVTKIVAAELFLLLVGACLIAGLALAIAMPVLTRLAGV